MQRTNRSREQWRELVAQWGRSGQSMEEFADAHGVRPKTLGYWKWKLRSLEVPQKRAVQSLAPAFVEVTPNRPQQREPFELWLRGGDRVVVPASFDADALQKLIDAVGSR
jgi:transposase-like protein